MKNLPDYPIDKLLTPNQIADYVGKSGRTVRREIKRGAFPNAVELPTGYVIPWGDVLAYIQNTDK